MKCPSCGSYNIKDYGDMTHWQCKECNWIFLKKEIRERTIKKLIQRQKELKEKRDGK